MESETAEMHEPNELHIPKAEWKEVIRRHIGKKLCHKYKSVALDILAVDMEIKCGFLFDYTCVSTQCLVQFLAELREQNLIKQNSDLRLVSIFMDNIIYNRKVLNDVRNSWCNYKFIDISHFNETPKLMNPDCPNLFDSRKAYEDLKTKDTEDFFEIDLSNPENPNIHPSTLFGVIIGYPVIYWYQMMLKEDAVTCPPVLSMEPLKCVQIYRRYHLLYSFSFPARFWKELEIVLTNWFQERQSENLLQMLHPLRIEIETKCLSQVAL